MCYHACCWSAVPTIETQAQFLLHSTLMYTCLPVLTQLTQTTYASTHTHHCTQPILTTAHNPYSPLHTTHTHHCTQPILTTAHNPYSPLHTTHTHHCTQPILTTAHNPYSPLLTTHTHHCTQPILTTAHNPYSPLHTIHTHHCSQPILTTAHNPYSPLHTTHTHHCTQPILTTAHNPYSPLHTNHTHHCTQPILTPAHNPWNTFPIAGVGCGEVVFAQSQFVLSDSTVHVCLQKVDVFHIAAMQPVFQCVSKAQLLTQDIAVANPVYPVPVTHSPPGIVEVLHHPPQVAGGVPVDELNLYNGCRYSAGVYITYTAERVRTSVRYLL